MSTQPQPAPVKTSPEEAVQRVQAPASCSGAKFTRSSSVRSK